MKAILITSSILIVVMAALRPLLRGRFRPLAQYALWLIVALRLLVPVEWAVSSYSALALLSRAEEPSRIVEAIGQIPIPAQSYGSAHEQALQEYEKQVECGELVPHISQAEIVNNRTSELMRGPTLSELAEQYVRPVWLGGAALMGAWFLLVNFRLRRKLRRALPVETDCPLPVYVSPELPSPCLCGLFRPAVYVTPAALADPNRLRHVLTHELTHYRHGDHLWSLVRCLCLCVYWFDPLVWWAAAMSRQDCELACDAGAIRRLGEEERIPYGRTLVAMIAEGRNPLLQAATTMTGGKRRVKERVELIARRPKTIIAVTLAAALILGLTAGFTFTGAPEEPGAKTLDNLRERLEDIPEELRDDVKTSYLSEEVKNNTLVIYYLPVMWENSEDGQEEGPARWTLTVTRWSRTQFDAAGYPETNDTTGSEMFAQDSKYYYTIDRPFDVLIETNGWEPYRGTFDAIQAFAMEAVLETEGVEPFSEEGGTLSADTLQERLNNVPEEITGVRTDLLSMPVTYSSLVDYCLDISTDWEGAGWLMSVCQWDQAEFEGWFYSVGSGAFHVFARDMEHYYATFRPTSVEYPLEYEDRFAAAQQAIGDYALEQVLATEGVEPFDAEAMREQDYLLAGKTYADIDYFPYKAVDGTMDAVWVFRVVQPARQGEGGVWIPERVAYYDSTGYLSNIEHIKPDTGGLTVLEYGEQLQAEADAGNADWATDPVEMLRRYVQEAYAHAFNGMEVPTDSFHNNGLNDIIWPTQEQKVVLAVAEQLMAAPSVRLYLSLRTLADADRNSVISDSYDYTADPAQDFNRSLSYLATSFSWEEFDWGTTEDPHFPYPPRDGAQLYIQLPDYSVRIGAWENSDLVYLHDEINGTVWYHARWAYPERYGASGSITLFEYLRSWFDVAELSQLQITSVPDRGQSHEEVVEEWIQGYEGAYLKCAPGSQYACTYIRPENVQADSHSWMDKAALDEFAQSRGRVGDDYGKTWFTFMYRLVFVPVDQSTSNGFWAGNTEYYEGDDAPEGALIYSRVAHMSLIDGNWVCEGTGTGW